MVNTFAVALVLIGSFMGSLGAFVIKKGTNKHGFFALLLTKYFWGGILIYVASSVLYLTALQREALTLLYPLVSTTYIWATVLSVQFLGEKTNHWKILGLFGIVAGIVLIGIGS